MININRNPSREDIRKFGWAMLGGFTFLAGFFWFAAWGSGTPLAGWAGTKSQIAAIVCALSAVFLFTVSRVSISFAKHVYRLWMTVGLTIGTVISTILLTLMFVLVLPVFSLIVRLGDPLRKKQRTSNTYWEDFKPHEHTLERMGRLF